MDTFKIELYEKETGKPFPRFRLLNEAECNMLYSKFCRRLHIPIPCNTPVFDLFQTVGEFIVEFNALDDGFNISEWLTYLGLAADDVFINWDNFQTIDSIGLNDFSECFHDIWYPSSDNMLFFPQNMSFMIMIRHDGAVYSKTTV